MIMGCHNIHIFITVTILLTVILTEHTCTGMTAATKQNLKMKVVEMFKHAYGSYMNHAFPADELMPLSCKGRYRGSEPSRGDVDDSLGNFTLTLIDSLDTLALLGDLPEFERAVQLVVEHTRFDTDVIVSVFETNIRVLGGLLGGHVMAAYFKRRKQGMDHYKDELLSMAKDLGNRLLPAFNTPTGIPYPRINLKHGVDGHISQNHRDTCTACAGTMVLEFAALSRLTGEKIFEEKAHKAMDYLWNQRHRSSDLVGTIINIYNGDWIRRESGVGAGIDSYYEYLLKAYILLGDDTYLTRFNKHYEAIMKYISQGPVFMDVHMHRPLAPSRNFMDALLAFWPGLQVLKGDIEPAIEMHEMLYQVMQKHNFLPEAFTSDHHIHWGHHPLRPEFVESTYFLYKATGDTHYLDVGQKVIENLDEHARVNCGFAAIKDVTMGTLEDQMDSFVLAETFKYLYLLYAEKSDLLFDVDDYIFTTEAHLLPLSLSRCNNSQPPAMRLSREMFSHLSAIEEESRVEDEFGDSEHNTCPNPSVKFKQSLNYAQNLRAGLKKSPGANSSPNPQQNQQQCTGFGGTENRLKAIDFVAGNKEQLQQLRDMGIRLMTMEDGRIQLLHTATEALTPQLAEHGLKFMQEMIELSKTAPQESQNEPMVLQVITPPHNDKVYKAGPAQFGYDLKSRPAQIGRVAVADPFKVCSPITNPEDIRGRIAVLERGDCMFVDKARHLQKAGAIGGIVIDHTAGTSSAAQPLFAMSGDGNNNVYIPMLFLFHAEGQQLLEIMEDTPNLEVVMTAKIEVIGKSVPAGPEKAGVVDSPQGTSPPIEETIIQSQQWTSSQGLHMERQIELHPLQEVTETGTYKLQTGSQNVKMKVEMSNTKSDPASPVAMDMDIIHLETLPDGSKQLSFKFDRVQKGRKKFPDLPEIYEELVKALKEKTNFDILTKKDEYLTAIVKMLEAAYYGSGKTEVRTQELFEELSNELELISEDVKGSRAPEEGAVGGQQQEPNVEILHASGMGVRVTSRTVKSAAGDATDQMIVNSQESYAGVEDFHEESVESTEQVGVGSEDYDKLKDMNPKLAEGILDAVEKSLNANGDIRTEAQRVKREIRSDNKEIFNAKFEKTVKKLNTRDSSKQKVELNERNEQTDEQGNTQSQHSSGTSSRKLGDL